ncbi:SCO family protein [Alkalicoccus halolimnae]|uniref:SCO family protein n=1 Tax=Alkalicoccus halolimnae TaxID=1667239 RepID=A0A5C7F5J8_9BACI|nr:SCO family protein [Alkalicoccus halolimnae]TXF85922.1 SCO family protein [Alkalicoccus halolimnae]
MKKLAGLGGFALLLSGCSFLYEDASESAQGDSIIDTTVSEDQWEVSGIEAVNQHEEEVSVEDLEGGWWIANTIFTRCPTVCTVMTPNMADLQTALQDEEIDDVRLISFTVDPEFDTPERLESYGESYSADFESWDFLTGYEEEELQTFVQESFKAQIQEVPEQEDIMHPTRFFLVGPDGSVHRMYAGEDNFDAESTVEDLQQVINE